MHTVLDRLCGHVFRGEAVIEGVVRPGLGNLPVLAKLAVQVAAAVAMEKDRLEGRTWKKGFFSMGSTWTAHGLP